MNDMVNPGHLGIPMLLTVKRQDSAPGAAPKCSNRNDPN
jgi:hypothetical protein